MRIGAAMALLAALVTVNVACNRQELFRQYEYEEEIYLALDGSATVYVNTSVAALDALRGASFDTSPSAQIDRDAVRTLYVSSVTRVTRRPALSRRSGRRFIHVRLDIDDITRLSEVPPFAWSQYQFSRRGELFTYHQTIGAAAGRATADVGWTGNELVAFRLHMPSTVVADNAEAANHRRGNILVWEQRLTDRLRGEPLTLDAQIESQSILSRTLLLFGATFVAVAVTFGLVLWWVLRKGKSRYNPAP